MDDALRQLRAIIRQKSLRIGEFTLSSGKRSSYYLDCRMTTLDPTGALLIGRLNIMFADAVQHQAADEEGPCRIKRCHSAVKVVGTSFSGRQRELANAQ